MTKAAEVAWRWMRTSKIPAASCAVTPDIERHLRGKAPSYTSSSGAAQQAATAKSTRVEAFRVLHTETKSTYRGGIERMSQREKTIGWIIRTTHCSQWAGEGTSVSHEFVLGARPGNLHTFDCRFAAAADARDVYAKALDLCEIQNTLVAEWVS